MISLIYVQLSFSMKYDIIKLTFISLTSLKSSFKANIRKLRK